MEVDEEKATAEVSIAWGFCGGALCALFTLAFLWGRSLTALSFALAGRNPRHEGWCFAERISARM